jgi:LAO/AO transport system kinase
LEDKGLLSDYKTYKPEWAPSQPGSEFAATSCPALKIRRAVKAGGKELQAIKPTLRREFTVDEYVDGYLSCDALKLARAITIIESNSRSISSWGQEIIQRINALHLQILKVGITGVPGAGKTPLLRRWETDYATRFTVWPCMAVDPSSFVSTESFMGDKTRMETLSKRLRPSSSLPFWRHPGRCDPQKQETLLLLRGRRFDTKLVETVGVGQNEITVRSRWIFFLAHRHCGRRDDLQGIKKVVIENADAIQVNKADGDHLQRALNARAEYEQVLHYLPLPPRGWKTKAYTCSAHTGEGVARFGK